MTVKEGQTKIHVRRLQEAFKQIPDLRKLPNGAFNPTFEAWKLRVNQSLETIFGAGKEYSKQFKRLSFCVPQFRPAGPGGWGGDDQREFEGDLTISGRFSRMHLRKSTSHAHSRNLPPLSENVRHSLWSST